MKNKTFWIGFVVVFVVLQALGFVVHVVMMDDTYKALGAVFRPEAEMQDRMWMMIASAALSLLMFCYIFTKGYEGKGIAEGARYGGMIALLMAGVMSVDQHVIYPVPGDVAVIWFVSGAVSLVVGGAVFAAIYKPDTAG